MSRSPSTFSEVALCLVLGGVGVLILFLRERAYWQEHISRWADTNQFSLIYFRAPKFFGRIIWRRPRLYTKDESQITFRVKVRTRDGTFKEGGLTFDAWYPFVGSPMPPREQWD